MSDHTDKAKLDDVKSGEHVKIVASGDEAKKVTIVPHKATGKKKQK